MQILAKLAFKPEIDATLVNSTDTSQYVYAASLQQGFIDKRTGEPLSGGIVTFKRDLDHTAFKPIFEFSGNSTNPNYVEMPNPFTLSAIGTFADPDNGNDFVPVFNPFDADGNPDPYFITVVASDGYPQTTYSNFPFVSTGGTDQIVEAENIIPNGQFSFHQNLPDDGLISQAVTPVAFGGWNFVQDAETTATNYVTFVRYDAPIDQPDSNPRFACRVQCTSADATDTRKDLLVLFSDVNYLQNQQVTKQICAYSNDGVTHNVQFVVRKYFGDTDTSSPPSETIITTFQVTPDIQNFLITFQMGNNIGETLADDDTDHLEFVLRSPLSTVSDIFYTDDLGAIGQFAELTYPPTSPEQAKAFAFPASIQTPALDGSDIGKFLQIGIWTTGAPRLGFIPQNPVPTGTVGETFSIQDDPDPGYLWMDGTEYECIDSNYSNLFGKIGWSCGTGQNGFRNASVSSTQMSTTWNRNDVAQTAPDAGTSGFTLTVHTAGTIGTYQVVYITPLAGSAITPGSYYRLIVSTSGPQFIQMFWFTVDSNGTLPTGIIYDVATQISVASTDTAAEVTTNLINNANGLFQVPGAQGLFLRCIDNGAGVDPNASSRTGSGTAASGNTGDNVGTFQAYAVAQHQHGSSLSATYNTTGTTTGSVVGVQSTVSANVTNTNVSSETRPSNLYVRMQIKT